MIGNSAKSVGIWLAEWEPDLRPMLVRETYLLARTDLHQTGTTIHHDLERPFDLVRKYGGDAG